MKIKIPQYWTPEQANEVAEFLSSMEIAIRKKYQVRILAHQLAELTTYEESASDEKKNWEDNDF